MSKIYALLLLLLVVVACSLRNRRADLFYSFDFQLTMPVQDTFSVGDTIWYEKDLYHLLFDKNNNHFFELKDYTLYFKLLSHKKDSTLVEDATPWFDTYTGIGEVTRTSDYFVYVYFFFESTVDRKFRIGLIPKKAGHYSASLCLANIFYSRQEMNYLDLKNPIYWHYRYPYRNNGASNQYTINGIELEVSKDSLLICDKSAVEEKEGVYAFYVKEASILPN